MSDAWSMYINGMTNATTTSGYQRFYSGRIFTIPEDGLYNIQFNKTDGNSFTESEIQVLNNSGQVEVGSTPTGYEPYKGQTLTVSTPNGLPGIPVASGGNYTDANGQQWICAEKDYARGVYIQRCGHYVFNGSEQWSGIVISTVNGTPYVRIPVARSEKEYDTNILCNLGKGQRWVGPEYTLFINGYEYFAVGGDALRGATNLDEFKAILAESPIELIYKLETPIETPLPAEELAAYAALHTYRDRTTVSNDAGAYMAMEYVINAKKYIDKQIASSFVSNATVE
jgi:hypothetical protein